ncbi:MAG: hypothetical protein F6K25_15385 [Okeania sp. SIO2G4]|uniref:hypothetical protein n=1 Tax=unclassified Okeania TaxID=2634635 RepID=UPI0013BB4DDE|nr:MULTISPECIES: hypothetical protein [unclassified Okeania]NEP73325.1 hypothetical protein [Okeania sp. SIO2G5]NEP94154.1 hypothetical protein [Okeania sp. SIO2F5]NEQ92004.1 hypothetical protein [Okeania sp. SIO2G4]
MQETQNTELFSELSTEESATINGGHHFDGYDYGRFRRYSRRPVSYHYHSYRYSRPVRYSYRRYDCY